MAQTYGEVLKPYKWSNELALSASRFLQKMDGCHLIPGQIIHDDGLHDEIKAIATYEDFHRIVLLPKRFDWDRSSPREQIWDLFLDDDGVKNRYHLLNNHYDSIGMACNCNTEFGEICIIDLGKNVVQKDEFDPNRNYMHYDDYQYYIYDAYTDIRDQKRADNGSYVYETYMEYNSESCQSESNDYFQCLDEQLRRRNLEVDFYVPEFKLPHDPTCATGRLDGFCGEIDYDVPDHPGFLIKSTYDGASSDKTYYEFLDVPFFRAINQMRRDPLEYIDSTFEGEMAINPYLPTAINELTLMSQEMKSWPEFEWNYALERAARHLVNDMGPCGTTGDMHGDYIPQILRKYYTKSVEDLDVLEVKFNPFGNLYSPPEVEVEVEDGG